MKQLTGKGVQFFVEQGRRGGLKRARSLSRLQRITIASRAAKARWQAGSASLSVRSIRLNRPDFNDPVYLEELLSEGSLESWRELCHRVSERPFGPSANALERVLSSTEIYGVVPLWRGILKNMRGSV